MAKRVLAGIASVGLLVLGGYLLISGHGSYLALRIVMGAFFMAMFLGSRERYDLTFGLTFTSVYLLLEIAVHGWKYEIDGVSLSVQILGAFAIVLVAGACFGYATKGFRQRLHRT